MADQKYKYDPVFDLNRDMLEHIYDQFNIKKLVSDFKFGIEEQSNKEVDIIAQKVFGTAADSLVQNVVDTADKEENRDRGYQILRQHCMRPEVGPFPHLIQRFIEVLYLSINPKLPEVGFLESSRRKIEYWIDEKDCDVYSNVKEICGQEIAVHMPCMHLCVKALDKLAGYWGNEKMNREIEMSGAMVNDHLCKFSIIRPGIALPKVTQMRWEE